MLDEIEEASSDDVVMLLVVKIEEMVVGSGEDVDSLVLSSVELLIESIGYVPVVFVYGALLPGRERTLVPGAVCATAGAGRNTTRAAKLIMYADLALL